MRKSTVKRFKRFDLLLRNDDKVCIIDWKFSKVDAHYKIAASANKSDEEKQNEMDYDSELSEPNEEIDD